MRDDDESTSPRQLRRDVGGPYERHDGTRVVRRQQPRAGLSSRRGREVCGIGEGGQSVK